MSTPHSTTLGKFDKDVIKHLELIWNPLISTGLATATNQPPLGQPMVFQMID